MTDIDWLGVAILVGAYLIAMGLDNIATEVKRWKK